MMLILSLVVLVLIAVFYVKFGLYYVKLKTPEWKEKKNNMVKKLSAVTRMTQSKS